MKYVSWGDYGDYGIVDTHQLISTALILSVVSRVSKVI